MKKASWFAIGLTLLAIATPAAAQDGDGFRIGPHVGWGDDFDFSIGATTLIGLGNAVQGRLAAIGAFDYFLDCENCTYFELTGGLLYTVAETPGGRLGVGGGLNYARISYDEEVFGEIDSFDDVGLAVLGTYLFPLGPVDALAGLRVSLGDADQLVLSFALLFGG